MGFPRVVLVTAVTAAAATTAGTLTFAPLAGAKSQPSCRQLTKSVLAADGYTHAVGPTVTTYNYKKPSTNAANSLGTTLDFGKKAIVIGCVSPTDIKTLNSAAGAPHAAHATAAQYMKYLVAQSSGAMVKTPVGGVSDYLDFGNGKEDGLGSTASGSSVRLDAWVAGNYIFLTFTSPASPTPSPALLHLIKTTQTMY